MKKQKTLKLCKKYNKMWMYNNNLTLLWIKIITIYLIKKTISKVNSKSRHLSSEAITAIIKMNITNDSANLLLKWKK